MAGRKQNQLRPKVEKICSCGNIFITSHFRKMFCSKRCLNEKNHNSPKYNTVQRDYFYRRRYGFSGEEYTDLFNKQDGCCAICGNHQINMKRRLSVDHCHETNKVRGLLCQKCNRGLGLFNDSLDVLDKAKEYLKLQAA